MRWNWPEHVRLALLCSAVAGCGDASPGRGTDTADDPSQIADDAGADSAEVSDAERDAASEEGTSDAEEAGADEVDAAAPVATKEGVARADAALPEEDGGASEADSGALPTPDDPTGWSCHQRDADGPGVIAMVVAERWAAPAGGTLVPGTYFLIAEEHFVPAAADDTEAAECEEFPGTYRETLWVTSSEWSRVAQYEGTEGREIWSYKTMGTELSRSRLCPAGDQTMRQPFSASGSELRIFDALARNDGTIVCEYMYAYQRTQ